MILVLFCKHYLMSTFYNYLVILDTDDGKLVFERDLTEPGCLLEQGVAINEAKRLATWRRAGISPLKFLAKPYFQIYENMSNGDVNPACAMSLLKAGVSVVTFVGSVSVFHWFFCLTLL